MAKHHFLCCLPLRLGALLLSLFQFIVNACAAGMAWYILAENHNTHILNTSSLKNSVITFAITTTLTAIYCFIGFLGAILKRTSYIAIYAQILAVFFGIKLIVAIFEIIALYKNPDGLLKVCVDNGNSTSDCENSLNQSKWILILGFLVPVLVEGYGLLIIYQYGSQLEERDSKRASIISLETGNAFSYASVKPSSELLYGDAPKHQGLYAQARGSTEALSKPLVGNYSDPYSDKPEEGSVHANLPHMGPGIPVYGNAGGRQGANTSGLPPAYGNAGHV
ncbi:hypothetical protein JAAARDRAFT_195945 [Jaapia argillacea MUCL 33604]|uniref:Uncharacterized protein n=1 Tax=Jaapia argillacea MUCL 33604 TaxID=933084 RepID=A0A067PUW1_9AGAM|nr:hypothetical protein JAAARDRAFT_195945 [Jaapia argillacea MUCL 33604]